MHKIKTTIISMTMAFAAVSLISACDDNEKLQGPIGEEPVLVEEECPRADGEPCR